MEKRVREDLPNITGTVEVRAAVLKAVDSIEDEETRKAGHQVLKAHNETIGQLAKTHGVLGTAETDGAESKLDTLPKAHAKAHEVSEDQAYSAVIKTAEGRDLYDQSLAESGS